MLRQEINLYRSFEGPGPRSPFSAWKLLWLSSASFLGILLLIYFYTIWDVHHLATENTRLKAEAAKLSNDFYTIKSQYPSIFFSENLEQKIGELHAGVSAQEKIFQSLTDSVDFSRDLTALARTVTPNVWLTSIMIDKGGYSLTLRGVSVSMDDLQRYITALSQDKEFAGFTVNINNIANDQNDGAANKNLTFELNLVKKT